MRLFSWVISFIIGSWLKICSCSSNSTNGAEDGMEKEDIRSVVRKACNLSPTASSPNEYDLSRKPYGMQVVVALSSLIEVNEVEETVTFMGGAIMGIQIDCIRKQAVELNKTQVVPRYWIMTNTDEYWRPPVVHMNSRGDYGLTNDVYTTLLIYPFSGLFRYAISGFFTSNCQLNFRRFPWGVSVCNTSLGIWLSKDHVNIDPYVYQFYLSGVEEGFVSKNIGWNLLSAFSAAKVVTVPGIPSYNVIDISFTIERRPDYYVINIIIPCLIITIIQLATLILPPEHSERATFAVTILLSFTLIQANVLANIPKTPADILLTDLILATSIMAMLMTSYGAVSCAWVNSWPKKAEQIVSFLGLECRYCRAVDVIAFVIFTLMMTGLILGFLFPMVFGTK